jgi:hypothetical protein
MVPSVIDENGKKHAVPLIEWVLLLIYELEINSGGITI